MRWEKKPALHFPLPAYTLLKHQTDYSEAYYPPVLLFIPGNCQNASKHTSITEKHTVSDGLQSSSMALLSTT